MHVVSVDEGEHSEEAARGEWHPSARRLAWHAVDAWHGVAPCRRQGLIDHRPRLTRNVHAASWLAG